MNRAIRNRILTWYQSALEKVEPYAVTRQHLEQIQAGSGSLVVLAIGKAAVAMAEAARDVYGDRITTGIIVTKMGQYTSEVDGFAGIEAGHPIPDDASLKAGEMVLDAVGSLTEADTVIALISGGGSALLEHPVSDISLMDLQVTTELLMYGGAGIYDLNTVRKALSQIKGGGLRRTMGDARCVTLLLSDVLGNDHTVIASGPTVLQPISRNRAWRILEEFRVQDRVPASVRNVLTSDTVPDDSPDTSRDVREVIADNTTFLDAVVAAAQSDGLRTRVVWPGWQDDARELGYRMVADCRSAGDDIDALFGGGEATSRVQGDGLGGRNTETALVAAMELTVDDHWVIASLSSDGDDGNSGSAGAIVDATVVTDRDAAESALDISDSAGFLGRTHALAITGPTGTNVNDVYIAVRHSAISGDDE